MSKQHIRKIFSELITSGSHDIPIDLLDFSDELTKTWYENTQKSPTSAFFKMQIAKGIRLLDSGLLKIKGITPKPLKIENYEQKYEQLFKQNRILIESDKLDFYNLLSKTTPELILPPSSLKGCGKTTEKTLVQNGIYSVYDLLSILPSSYIDLRRVSTVEKLQNTKNTNVLLKVKITSVSFFRGKLSAKAEDETGDISMFWFSVYPGLYSLVSRGNTVYVRGTFDFKGKTPHFVHPLVSLKRPENFIIKYPNIEGVGEARFRKLILDALEKIKHINFDLLPKFILQKYNFKSWIQSVSFLHNPPKDIDYDEFEQLANGAHKTRQRISFEELFFIQLALARKNKDIKTSKAPKILKDEYEKIVKVFPFELTAYQKTATTCLIKDMSEGMPMNRLLQGDVGSGKTAVAFVCAALVMSVGRQVAFMAPTTLLAEQQYATLSKWAHQLGYKTALLISDLPSGTRESVLARLENHDIDLLVGTQSLIQNRVEFADLGLIVIDEQHRFGVKQRATLRSKGMSGYIPHLLVMTATPIPRSLALTLYGELDLLIMKGKPPGRLTVITKIISTQRQKTALLKKLDKILKSKNEKIFVVTPLIDKGAEKQRADVYSVAKTLSEIMTNAKIEILHGRMSSSDKEKLISKFKSGEINVLVSTTVIEVGMDIPDASYMIILEADRFGLAALHQLRGRIGRTADKQAFCYLFTSKKVSKTGKERIKILENTNDGFELAETDLRMRGPGEILGTKQSGMITLQYASLIHNEDLLLNARKDARELLENTVDFENSYPFLTYLTDELIQQGIFGEEGG